MGSSTPTLPGVGVQEIKTNASALRAGVTLGKSLAAPRTCNVQIFRSTVVSFPPPLQQLAVSLVEHQVN
jgi:hypothetical protein